MGEKNGEIISAASVMGAESGEVIMGDVGEAKCWLALGNSCEDRVEVTLKGEVTVWAIEGCGSGGEDEDCWKAG